MRKIIRVFLVFTVAISFQSSFAATVSIGILSESRIGFIRVNLTNAEELQEHLREHGVTSGIILCTSVIDNEPDCETEMEVADLTEEDFEWLTEGSLNSRYLHVGYYDREP